jgi:hypothetical protein
MFNNDASAVAHLKSLRRKDGHFKVRPRKRHAAIPTKSHRQQHRHHRNAWTLATPCQRSCVAH